MIADVAPRLAARLEQLRAERHRGLVQLQTLDRRREELRDTLLRIEGAIEVLEPFVVGAAEAAEAG
jgi:hypothetical protein